VTRSTGAVGPSADNGLAESFNATLKRETLPGASGWDPRCGPSGVVRLDNPLQHPPSALHLRPAQPQGSCKVMSARPHLVLHAWDCLDFG
jgi:transposase InsO family protein